MIKLKPCPFCGGEAAVEKTGIGGYHGGRDIYHVVVCEKCGAAGKRIGFYESPKMTNRFSIWVDPKYNPEIGAADIWNQRTVDATVRRALNNLRSDILVRKSKNTATDLDRADLAKIDVALYGDGGTP
jgi:Lar family restriction alleviation protein